MKTTIASVLLFLFLFSTKSCLSSVTKHVFGPLIDSDGDEVLTDVPYYMVSPFRGAAGGGLDLGWSPDHRCPRFVMQTPSDLHRGTPVVLKPTYFHSSVIHEVTDVNITFVPGYDPFCRTSTMWTVDDYDPSTGKGWINTGGFRGIRSWFKVVQHSQSFSPNTYGLVVCYSLSDSPEFACDLVDRFPFGDRFRRLGFQQEQSESWPFRFVKAPTLEQVVGKEPN